MPKLFIIAGPNGAGKSTYVQRFLAQEVSCREFVNADLIAAGLSPYAPDHAAFEAGRIMLHRVRELASRRMDFAFETTLSGRTYAPCSGPGGKRVIAYGSIFFGFLNLASRVAGSGNA